MESLEALVNCENEEDKQNQEDSSQNFFMNYDFEFETQQDEKIDPTKKLSSKFDDKFQSDL